MGQLIHWCMWIITLCVLLCSPNQRCLAFLKMESRTDVPVYATSQLTTGEKDNGKITDIHRWKDSTDQTSRTSQPTYLYDIASQPSVTIALEALSAKAEMNPNPKSNQDSLQASQDLGASYPTTENLKINQDLDDLLPTNSELSYTQTAARSNSFKDAGSLTTLMLTTAFHITPSLQAVTESEVSSTAYTRDAADDNLQTDNVISDSKGQTNSSDSQFLVTDLQWLNVTEGDIMNGFERTSVSANAVLDRDEQMITSDLGSETSDDKNKALTEPPPVSNQSHVTKSIESQASLNDSHLVSVSILTTMSSQGTIRQSSGHHSMEQSDIGEHINTADTTTFSVPFVSVLKDEWQNTNLGMGIEAETVHNGTVTEVQAPEQNLLNFNVKSNNVSKAENSTLISVTGSRTLQTTYISKVSKLLVERKEDDILPTVDTKQDEIPPTFSGPTSADATTTSATEYDATILVNIKETVYPSMEKKKNTIIPSLWTITASADTQIQGFTTERKASEGKINSEPTERVGTSEVHVVTAPTMTPFPAVTQESTTFRNTRRTTFVSPIILNSERINSVAPTVSQAGSSSSVPDINNAEGFSMATEQQVLVAEVGIMNSEIRTSEATVITRRMNKVKVRTTVSAQSSMPTTVPLFRYVSTAETDAPERLDSEEEEEEDEDEDTDSEDESIEDDTELPTFTSISPTFQESLSDGINLTNLAGMSFHVSNALEWEKQNQGLVRSWMEKLKDKAGYMSGMLLPVGVGIAGALFILGALYSIKVVNRKRRNGFKRNKRKRECSSMQDRVMLLADSSEDEF